MIFHDDDDEFPKDKVDGLVAELRQGADERDVAQLIKALNRAAGRKRDGVTWASVMVACARIMAEMMNATPAGSEANAYVSAHALIDSYLHEADADRGMLH